MFLYLQIFLLKESVWITLAEGKDWLKFSTISSMAEAHSNCPDQSRAENSASAFAPKIPSSVPNLGSGYALNDGEQWNPGAFDTKTRPHKRELPTRHLSWSLEAADDYLLQFAIGPLPEEMLPSGMPCFSKPSSVYLVPKDVGKGYNAFIMAVVSPTGKKYLVTFKHWAGIYYSYPEKTVHNI